MKTTVDLDDDLAARARLRAASAGTTLRALVEQGLRRVLDDAESPTGADDARYVLPDRAVGEGWMRAEFSEGGWQAVRDEIYTYPFPGSTPTIP